MTISREGGRILVDQLVAHGANLAFCVPGESFLPVLDALHEHRDRLKLVVCRQESGAANMAEAHGKLTAATTAPVARDPHRRLPARDEYLPGPQRIGLACEKPRRIHPDSP